MKYIYTIIVLFAFISCQQENAEVVAARQLLERQIGKRAYDIELSKIDKENGRDVCRIQAKDGKLILYGSSSVAFCYAFHTYLTKACHLQQTWSAVNLNLPEYWVDFSSELMISPYQWRYFLNVCTFGYTTPYWDWKRWEKELDWMALHGVNMALSTVANEAIAERVWLKMGLAKDEIRNFFTGPAHLPWHRMGNLNSWDGPLSDEWMNRQLELQHKILERMRELGITPIAPAFAGFVPKSFILKHPDVEYKHLQWGGFDERLNTYVLSPTSHYFEKIGKMFIEEWEKEFGKHIYYLSDSFNEMKLPIDENDARAKHDLLAKYGEAIYNSIHAGNSDAIWVTQGWTFGYQHDFWDQESLEALLSRVPNEKMMIIDLGNDYPKWVWNTEQTWKVHNGFYGKQWIFSYVPNFGGKTLFTGDLQMYSSSSVIALQAENKGNLVGFGSAPEGLENNEVVYELLADMGWSNKAINLDCWMEDYCKARYGMYSDSMKRAWDIFRRTVYASLYSYPRFTWQTVIPDSQRISKYDMNDEFLKGVEYFLQCADTLKNSRHYINDALELASYYLAVKADQIYVSALSDKTNGNMRNALNKLENVIELLKRVDRLLASHPLYRLEPWISAARSCATSDVEQNHYERNAKRLITTWGGGQEDYAARFWSGLIKDYYIPRLQIYFSSDSLSLDQWEETWINSNWKNSTIPYDNPLQVAIELVKSCSNHSVL